MSHQALAALGVSLLVLLAGCGAALPGDQQSRDPYEVSVTERPALSTNATQTSVQAPAELVAELRTQESKFQTLDNYTLQFNRTQLVEGEVSSFRNETFFIDRTTGRGRYVRQSLRGQGTGVSMLSIYRDDGVFEAKRISPRMDAARYGTVGDPERSPVNLSRSLLTNQSRRLATLPLQRNGTTTFDGEVVRRYTANEAESVPGNTGLLDGYRIVVLVDQSGLIRLIELRRIRVTRDGVRYVTRERLSITETGSTTVTRPGWVGNHTD